MVASNQYQKSRGEERQSVMKERGDGRGTASPSGKKFHKKDIGEVRRTGPPPAPFSSMEEKLRYSLGTRGARPSGSK